MAEKRLPQVIVAQLGVRRHYAVPVLLHCAGQLAHFYTDVYSGKGSFLHLLACIARLIPETWHHPNLRRLMTRREDRLPSDKITAFNMIGLLYSQAIKNALDLNMLDGVYRKFAYLFSQAVVSQTWPEAQAVFATQGTTLPIFFKAKRFGLRCLLEQITAPKRIASYLFEQENDLWLGWEDPYPNERIVASRIEMEADEWEAADYIFCPSDFVIQGMIAEGVDRKKLRLVPYGIDLNKYSASGGYYDGSRPLRVLFLSSVSLGKGVQYLYQAIKNLAGLPLEVRLVGPVAIREPFRSHLSIHAELTGQVTRFEVYQHYRWADLFVFPTICDSFGVVQIEALAAGLPVIATPNCGSVVREGVNGFIVPIRNAVALAEKIELLAKNPELLAWMSENAREQAEAFSWNQYQQSLIGSIKELF